MWLVIVGDMFNSDKQFAVPKECSDLGTDPNLHPHARTSQVLKAHWSEVRLRSFLCLGGTATYMSVPMVGPTPS